MSCRTQNWDLAQMTTTPQRPRTARSTRTQPDRPPALRPGTRAGRVSDIDADVTAEQFADPITLGDAGHHPVETSLQTPDFRPFVHADRYVDASLIHNGSAFR